MNVGAPSEQEIYFWWFMLITVCCFLAKMAPLFIQYRLHVCLSFHCETEVSLYQPLFNFLEEPHVWAFSWPSSSLSLRASIFLFGCNAENFTPPFQRPQPFTTCTFWIRAAPDGPFTLLSRRQKISHHCLPHIDSTADLWHAVLWAPSWVINLPQSHAHQT